MRIFHRCAGCGRISVAVDFRRGDVYPYDSAGTADTTSHTGHAFDEIGVERSVGSLFQNFLAVGNAMNFQRLQIAYPGREDFRQRVRHRLADAAGPGIDAAGSGSDGILFIRQSGWINAGGLKNSDELLKCQDKIDGARYIRQGCFRFWQCRDR